MYLLPAYATRAREWLGDLPHIYAVRSPEREDLETVQRVWLLSMFEKHLDTQAALEDLGFSKQEEAIPAPGVQAVLLTRNQQERSLYRFVEHLKEAKVWHEKNGKRVPCDRWLAQNNQGEAVGRYSCRENSDWFYVAPEYHRMGEHTRRCLWAHPPGQGRLVIAFADVPVQDSLHIAGGHTINSSVRAEAAVFMDVRVGEATEQRFRFELEDTWDERRLLLDTVGTTTTATVSFAISSPKSGANHFCFTADSRARTAP